MSNDNMKTRTYTSYNDFCALVAAKEGKKKQLSIGQIKETFKIMRILLNRAGVDIYRVVGSTPLEVFSEK